VNEDIPAESPAATGSRYQRHIRTDRVRPTGRSRASTFSSAINPAHQARGHSRNLSSSSVASISTVSSYAGDEFRRSIGLDTPRMNRLSLDTYNPPTSAGPMGMQQYYTVGANSPTGYSTPTSATFSIGTNSPRYSSGLHSPASSISRSGYQHQSKGPDRRLSVPGSNPFSSTQTTDSNSMPYMSPAPSAAALSRAGAQYASPLRSFADPRRDSLAAAESETRRRTWHPNTTTGLGSRPTSSGALPGPTPLFSQQQSNPTGGLRLPGIETFDNLDRAPPPSLIRRQPSPMELDPPTSHPTESQTAVATDDRNANRISWTAGIRNGMNQLEITKPQETPSSWNPANPNAGATDVAPRPSSARPASFHSRAPSETLPSIPSHPDEMNEDDPVSTKRQRRMAWYMQPPSKDAIMIRTSPDSSSDGDGAPTPVTLPADVRPAIVNSNGQIESHAMEGVEETPKTNVPAIHAATPTTFRSGWPQAPSYTQTNQATPFGLPRVYESSVSTQFGHSREPSSGMDRLEALVAVATSEQQQRD
jgi:C2H2 transcription facotor